MWRVGILTASDKASRGEREDESAKLLMELVKNELNGQVVGYRVVPDCIETLKENMIELIDRENVDLLLTTGGTGLSPRDVTPEATRKIIDREVPGLSEEMRRASLQSTRRALLTRAVSGTRGNTLIINLPGSPKGVKECFMAISDQLSHALNILQGKTGECATNPDLEEVR